MAFQTLGAGATPNVQRATAARLLGLFGAVTGAMIAAHAGGLRYNGSPSFPKGFYLLTALEGAPDLGDLVLACPPDIELFREAYRRHYIGFGTCPSGYTPILKKIAARAGDRVRVDGVVSVNGIAQPESAVFRVDGQGRPLPVYAGGIVPPDHVLLISDVYAGSFDGRYFGPLPERQLIGNARPILTW